MKNYFMYGVFYQIQIGNPRPSYGICAALWYQQHYLAGNVKGSYFSGIIMANNDLSVFEGEINDEYGKASIKGGVAENGKTLSFEKKYNAHHDPVTYKFTKDGPIYAGHFTIKGAPWENNSWAICLLSETQLEPPADEILFSPDRFKEEIEAAKAKW